MNPVMLQTLTPQMIGPLEDLMAACRQADGGTPYVYWSLLANQRPMNALWIIENELGLVGFISGHVFEVGRCEVTLLVHPAYRQQGVASVLCASLIPFCERMAISEVLFSVPSTCRDAWFACGALTRLQQEHHMRREGLQVEIPDKGYDFRQATVADMDVLVALDVACFSPLDPVKATSRFEQLFAMPQYDICLILQKDSVLGKAHLSYGEKAVALSDVAIFPAVQGQGHGYHLLLHAMTKAADKGHTVMTLEVDATQARAIALYEKHQFVRVESRDYWSIPMNAFAMGASTRYNRLIL